MLLSKLYAYKLLYILTACILFRIYFFGAGDNTSGMVVDILDVIRNNIYQKYLELLPSPHSELLAGMVLGLDRLYLVPTFNDILLKTGTIHVVVVSGFNIVIFFDFLQRIFGNLYNLKNFLIAEAISFVYAVFTGFEYPVVRAWVMCTLIYFAKFLGLKSSSFYILIITALVIILINPTALIDMSFQLSFLAVLGLMLFSSPVEHLLLKFINLPKMASFFVKDLSASFSAQLLVWPLISLKIGTVNVISPLANALLLWPLSYATAWGLFIALFHKVPVINNLLVLFTYPYLDYFVEGSVFLNSVIPEQLSFTINTFYFALYYILVTIGILWHRH